MKPNNKKHNVGFALQLSCAIFWLFTGIASLLGVLLS